MQDYFLCLEVICFIFVYTMVFDKEARIERAKSLFLSGFNCSQSVVGAFADIYGFTQEQAMRMSASFGGGIGRMRLTCGAACGMFMLAGLETGATDPHDREGNNWLRSLSHAPVPSAVLRCFACVRILLSYQLQKNALRNIMPSVLVCGW